MRDDDGRRMRNEVWILHFHGAEWSEEQLAAFAFITTQKSNISFMSSLIDGTAERARLGKRLWENLRHVLDLRFFHSQSSLASSPCICFELLIHAFNREI